MQMFQWLIELVGSHTVNRCFYPACTDTLLLRMYNKLQHLSSRLDHLDTILINWSISYHRFLFWTKLSKSSYINSHL